MHLMVHAVDVRVRVIVVAHMAWVSMCVVHCTTRADPHVRVRDVFDMFTSVGRVCCVR